MGIWGKIKGKVQDRMKEPWGFTIPVFKITWGNGEKAKVSYPVIDGAKEGLKKAKEKIEEIKQKQEQKKKCEDGTCECEK